MSDSVRRPLLSQWSAQRVAETAKGALRSLDGWILVGAAGLFVLFFAMEPVLYRALRPPRALYEAPSVLVSAFGMSRPYLLGWVLAFGALVVAPRRAWWRLPREARWLWAPAIACVLALTWHLTTLDPNWMLGRTFGVDRVLLVLVAAAAVTHPAFLAAFFVSALVVKGQLNVPGMYFTWTDTNVLYHAILILFLWTSASAVLERWPQRIKRLGDEPLRLPAASAWAVTLGILGAWYFLPATGKARLGWVWETNLAFIFRAAYEQHGWLAWLGPDTHARLADLIERFAIPMQIATMIAEGGVLFFFLSRWVTVGLLVLCLGMHVMIFATTGILFWKWSALLLAIIAVFVAMGPDGWRRQFPRWTMLIACGVPMLAYTFFGPRVTILAWYDSPFVYRFDMEATGESGQRYEVVPATLTPYDSRFAQSRFYFLTETPMISDCFGSVNHRDAYRAFCEARTPDEANAVIAEYGTRKTSSEERAKLEALLRRFLDATHEPRPSLDFGAFKAPLHITTGQRADATLPLYEFQEPLDRLEMTLVQRHYFSGRYEVISEEDVLAVEREAAPPESVSAR